MKIAIVVNGRAHEGGVTTFINTVVDPLRALGHTVDVVTIFGVSKYREVKPDFVTKADSLLRRHGLLTVVAYIISKVLLTWQLLHCHLRRKYDAILAIDVSATRVASCVRRFRHARVVQRVGASITRDLICQGKIRESSMFRRFFEREERLGFLCADAIIPNGSWAANYVRDMCPSASILHPLLSGVDESMFYSDLAIGQRKRQELGIDDDVWVLLFPARLDIRKGSGVAVRALRRLILAGRRCMLVCAGQGTERTRIESFAKEHQLEESIRLHGVVPHNQMMSLYAMADVTVVPSVAAYGYSEPMANSPLESMACGTPVIASKLGGIIDVITHEVTGLLVPPDDDQALSDGVARLQDEGRLRESIILNARHLVQERHSAMAVARKLVDMLAPEQC